MENKLINITETFGLLNHNFLAVNEFSGENNNNIIKFPKENDSEIDSSFLSFIEQPMTEAFDISKLEEIFQNSLNSRNTSNIFNVNLPVKRNRKKDDIKNVDNLVRKAKKVIFNSILEYDNYIIAKAYNYNIGQGINTKKLFKINYSQIKNTQTDFNKKLLNTPQKDIFSSNITTKYSNFPSDHNKILINKLLEEEDLEKREIFNNLFNITLLEFIQHLIGQKKKEELQGLDSLYKKQLIEMKNHKEYEELKNTINDYEKIFEDKKPRTNKIKK
jgi:hypothetical protein